MRKFLFASGALALALAAFVQPSSQAAAAAATAPTLTLSDQSPTRTESWGTVINYGSITAAPGDTVKVMLQGQVLPGYKWDITWVEAKCASGPEQRTGGNGLLGCAGQNLQPTKSATTGDPQAGYEFSQKNPVLSASGTEFEATIQVPNLPTTVRVDYAYFPPMKPGQTSNEAIKVFEANIVVVPAKP